MTETINESVSVNLWSSHRRKSAVPWLLSWRGRRYRITQVGLHHTYREGRTLIHVFTVTDGVTGFRLTFDTETLSWKLTDVDIQ